MSCQILNLTKQDDFVSISDIHVHSSSDERYEFLINFFKHQRVIESPVIFLLGDIFDVLVGEFDEYLIEYHKFFTLLNMNLSKGKKIIWIEGNHDFNFEKLIFKALKKNNFKNFIYSKNPLSVLVNQKKVYMGHGDELDEDLGYKKYKKMIRSHYAETIINNFLSYSFAMDIKKKMSEKSRSFQKDFNLEVKKLEYQRYANKVSQSFDFVITGHSHILEESEIYMNNGFFPKTKKFISYRNGVFSWFDL